VSETRILVVDDDPAIRDLLRDVLQGAGYTVDTAPDARSALGLVRETIYAAALFDFDLPDMDGVMLHRKIREMDPELASATIFMSGMVQKNEHLDYYHSASGGFLAKPFDAHRVVAEIARLTRPETERER
jgi:DNA-binding response OmpR family regulator